MINTLNYTSTYLRLLLLTLWLFKKLFSTKFQDGRQLLLVERCRTVCNKTHLSEIITSEEASISRFHFFGG